MCLALTGTRSSNFFYHPLAKSLTFRVSRSEGRFRRRSRLFCLCSQEKQLDGACVKAKKKRRQTFGNSISCLETPGLATTRRKKRAQQTAQYQQRAQFEKKENILCDCTNIELNFSFVASLVTFLCQLLLLAQLESKTFRNTVTSTSNLALHKCHLTILGVVLLLDYSTLPYWKAFKVRLSL